MKFSLKSGTQIKKNKMEPMMIRKKKKESDFFVIKKTIINTEP